MAVAVLTPEEIAALVDERLAPLRRELERLRAAADADAGRARVLRECAALVRERIPWSTVEDALWPADAREESR